MMPNILTPEFDRQKDILLFEGDGKGANLLWFTDYTCPFSRRLRDVLLRSIDRFKSLNPTFAVRLLPSQARPGAEIAARAAIAAHNQNRFADMNELLWCHDPEYSEDSVLKLARKLDLNEVQFQQDLYSEETTSRLDFNRKSAENSSPSMTTPMLFIDGMHYDGIWDEKPILEAIERPLGVRLELASTAFLQWAASAGFVLVMATLAAFAFVNFGGADIYQHVLHTKSGFHVGSFKMDLPIEVWINDGLMSLFFLLIGIEIKREIIDGELSDLSTAMLPIMGAIGGMLVPALIYYGLNYGSSTVHGWGVPMATDIAFTLGILALLGDRIPISLKIFISALAIADDLGAILVIAIFYGHGFDFTAFLMAAMIFGLMVILNLGKIYSRFPYLLLGVLLWYFIYESGLHATLAGVLTAIAIPSRPSVQIESVAIQARAILEDDFQKNSSTPSSKTVVRLQSLIKRLRDPGFHLQNALENWSNFLILPLFAFFNTGILIAGVSFYWLQPEVAGVIFGLLVGKPLGIMLIIGLAVYFGWAKLSSEISWMQLFGASVLCGIGFTMSIFISTASFEGSQLQSVKLAVLIASFLAAIIGSTILILASKYSVKSNA